jgi:hypothetical protein
MNYFLNELNNLAISNKYTKWYNALINRAISRNILDNPIENHHIFPVSFNRDWKNKNHNKVVLTIREHFICHLLLTKMFFGENRLKMVRAMFFLNRRNKSKSSRQYLDYKLIWIDHMQKNNPLFDDNTKQKISKALSGRTKETHDYIRIANIKKSQYTAENSQWLRDSRNKFNETIAKMTKEERKQKFGHEWSDEVRKKFSLERTGQTKENSDRVRKMSKTKIKNNSLLSAEERKAKHSTTTGMKWYHNDELRISKLMFPIIDNNEWVLGRKKYENI